MSYWLFCTNAEADTLPCFIICENLTQRWIILQQTLLFQHHQHLAALCSELKTQRGGLIRSICGAIVTRNVPFHWLHLQDVSDLKQTG